MAVAHEERRTQRSLSKWVPILGWLPHYSRGALRGDLTAGVAVTALIVPKNLGYAGIAGIPLQNGLYAAAAGALIYPLFCTSRHISTGPSSSLAAVAGGAVLVTGIGGEQAAELVAAIALVTGALFLLMAVLRLGWIARFLSKAVITGFLAGAAIDVVIGELPKLTGTSNEGDNAWRELSSWLGSLGAHTRRNAARRARIPGGGLRPACRRAQGSRGARPRRRRSDRFLAPRPRQSRRGARGSCSERPAIAGASPLPPCSRPTPRRSASQRPHCC